MRVYGLSSHTQHSVVHHHLVHIRRLHCSTLHPPHPPPHPWVLDMSSTLCCLLCLFACRPSCFDSRPRAANRVSTFTRVSKSLWVHDEGKFAYLCVCLWWVFEGYIKKADYKAIRMIASGRQLFGWIWLPCKRIFDGSSPLEHDCMYCLYHFMALLWFFTPWVSQLGLPYLTLLFLLSHHLSVPTLWCSLE